MLIDNHASPPAPSNIGTRILEIFLDDIAGRYRAVWNYQPHAIFHSSTRGSTDFLPNGNILAFYPDAVDGADHIIEVDYKTGQPKAQIVFAFSTFEKKMSDKQRREFEEKNVQIPQTEFYFGGGNRALAITSIGQEKWMGNDSL